MSDLLKEIGLYGIIPVAFLDNRESAVPLARALCDGGLEVLELTFCEGVTEGCLKDISEAFPDMIVGVGSVSDVDQVKKAVEAGARFVASCSFNPLVVDYCISVGVPVIAGVNSPSQVEMLLEKGQSLMKFFPAEVLGGMEMIGYLSEYYGDRAWFIPAGGISLENMNRYLKLPQVHSVSGDWVVDQDAVRNGDFASVERAASEAVFRMLGFHLLHVGINERCSDDAERDSMRMLELFGFERDVREKAIFSGTYIEFMRFQFLGEKGHIAIGTNNAERARFFLAKKGVGLRAGTETFVNGRLKIAYLDMDLAGFAPHITEVN